MVNNQGTDKLLELFKTPKIIGVVGNPNSGKSNLLYFLVSQLREKYAFNLYTYGLKFSLNEQRIHSVEELEVVRNSIVLIDEVSTIFNIEDRAEKRQIEQSIRLIHHNNNVLVFSALPETYKKFISSKLDAIILKRATIGDAINGSRVKKVITNYRGDELGAAILNIPNDTALVYDGTHYFPVNIPLMREYDSKANNPVILQPKNVSQIVR